MPVVSSGNARERFFPPGSVPDMPSLSAGLVAMGAYPETGPFSASSEAREELEGSSNHKACSESSGLAVLPSSRIQADGKIALRAACRSNTVEPVALKNFQCR